MSHKKENPFIQIGSLNNITLRILLLVGVSISRPLFLYNPAIFLIIAGGLLCLSGLFFNTVLRTDNLVLGFYVVLIRLTLFLASILLIIGGLQYFSAAQNKFVVLLFLSLMLLSLLAAIGETISRIIHWLQNPTLHQNNLYRSIAITIGMIGLLMALVIPDIVFGYGYKIYFDILLQKDITDHWMYVGFAISHTLPISDLDISKTIAIINRTPELQYFQMFQVYLGKIIEWIVIAILLNSLLRFLRMKNHT